MAVGKYGVMAGCGGGRAFTDQPSQDIFLLLSLNGGWILWVLRGAAWSTVDKSE